MSLQSFEAPIAQQGGSDVILVPSAPQSFDVPAILNAQFQRGQRIPFIKVIASAGSGTPTQLFTQSTPVAFATIQNISTANMTFAVNNPNVAAGVGLIMNLANAAGQGGGSFDVHNIDLSYFWFVVAATGNVVAVYGEV